MHIFYYFIRRVWNIFKDLIINERILDREVRLIDENGTQLGVMSKIEAQHIADARRLDLVKISPTARPPVCKIMDYGKYRFDMQKKDKEAKKFQKIVKMKEIKLSQTIDIGDIKTKAKHAILFLEDGDKVKVSLRMSGRQNMHPDVSVSVLNRFFSKVQDYATMDRQPTAEGRVVYMMLSPIKK